MVQQGVAGMGIQAATGWDALWVMALSMMSRALANSGCGIVSG
jgi:hypothetical protein